MSPVDSDRGFGGCYDDAAAVEVENENENNNDINVNVEVNVDDDDNGGGGNGGFEKIEICHNGHTQEVAPEALPAHYGHGDTLGPCEESARDPVTAEVLTEGVTVEEGTTEEVVEETSETTS